MYAVVDQYFPARARKLWTLIWLCHEIGDASEIYKQSNMTLEVCWLRFKITQLLPSPKSPALLSGFSALPNKSMATGRGKLWWMDRSNRADLFWNEAIQSQHFLRLYSHHWSYLYVDCCRLSDSYIRCLLYQPFSSCRRFSSHSTSLILLLSQLIKRRPMSTH